MMQFIFSSPASTIRSWIQQAKPVGIQLLNVAIVELILTNTQDLIEMTEKELRPMISVRCNENMNEIINYLSDRLLLNTSSVVRLSLANLYEIEKQKERKSIKDI